MRRFRHLGAALVMSVLVASGMVTFSAQLHAQGLGTGSTPGYCRLLQAAYDLTKSDYPELAAFILSKATEVGCTIVE